MSGRTWFRNKGETKGFVTGAEGRVPDRASGGTPFTSSGARWVERGRAGVVGDSGGLPFEELKSNHDFTLGGFVLSFQVAYEIDLTVDDIDGNRAEGAPDEFLVIRVDVVDRCAAYFLRAAAAGGLHL